MLCHVAKPAPPDVECPQKVLWGRHCRHPASDKCRRQEHERIDQTTKDEKVDLAEHEHYTDALFQPGLIFAEIDSPRFRSQGIRTVARWTAKVLPTAVKEIAGKQHFFTLKGAQYECSLNEPIYAISPSLRT